MTASLSVVLRGVGKSFGPIRALASVSAEFLGGQVSIVEGPNGSGKSTLLGIVGTLTRPSVGDIDHGKLGRVPSEIRSSLGWVGHETLCYGDLTGRENLELAAQLHGLDGYGAFVQASARFDLAAFAERPMRTCSRGQRQRIALARALVHQPKLLLLDEPTTGLDAASAARLVDVIRQEAKRGAVVLVVTHDRELAGVLGGPRFRVVRGRLAA